MIRRLPFALLLAGVALPAPLAAEVPGVAALLQQGRYWEARGRADLARNAYRRVLALDPANAEARKAINTPNRSPSPTPTPAPKPTPAASAPARASNDRPAATGQTAAPRPAAPTPAPRPADRGGDARSAGFQALDANDLATAERRFQAALSANRNDADASGGLGIVRLRQSRFAEAVPLLERASARGNASRWSEALTSSRFYGGLATAREKLQRGDVAGAESDAQALARLPVKDRGPALALLADIYERQGRYADAADLVRQAGGNAGGEAQLDSRVARNNALQAAQRGDAATAEREFQRGLQSDQSDPWIRFEYARYMLARGRVADANALVQSLQTMGSPDALYAAAMLHAQNGRPDLAQQLIDRIPPSRVTPAITRFAADLQVDAGIARARDMSQRGQVPQALAALRQLAGTPGLSAAALANIAGAMNDLGDTATAAAIAGQAAAAGPATPAAYDPIVRVLVRAGQDAAAADAIERARRVAEGTADGPQIIARLEAVRAASQADRLRLEGQYATAFDLLQQAWAAAPGDAEILASLARLYQSGNMPSQAAQTYQMVLASDPRDKGALIGLIGSAGANNDRSLANATIERALDAYPDDYEILAAAGEMEQARGDRGAASRYLRRAEASYAAHVAASGKLTGGNPFGAAAVPGAVDSNPFRARAAAAPAPAPVNPFALSGGRVPAAPSFPAGQAARQPVAFSNAPAYAQQPGMAGGAPVSADPVIARLQANVARLSTDSGPRAEVDVGYRQRSGETGLSQLRELSGTARISTDLAGGRVGLSATPVAIDAGRPTGSGLARFGRNATREAEGIVAEQPSQLVQADTQHASGVAVAASYEAPWIRLDVGTTPLGFEDTEVTWGFTAKPQFTSNFSGRAWVRREAVTDSVTSYAGTRDPVSGERWGQVMRTGGGMSLSFDRDGTGVYGDVSGYRYDGLNVRRNRGYQANIGGYMPAYADEHSKVILGLNLNWQAYDNNQNFFTFGHGGYFSPQSFFSVSLPIRYTYDSSRIEARVNVAPGFQSFQQDAAVLYPNDPAAQATLDSLKAENDDVRASYDSLSETGMAFAADGSLYYKVSPTTRIGGSVSLSTFGTYDEYRSTIGIRQSLSAPK